MAIVANPQFVYCQEQFQDRAANSVSYALDMAAISAVSPIDTIFGQGTPASIGGVLINQHDATLKALYAQVQALQQALAKATPNSLALSMFSGVDQTASVDCAVPLQYAINACARAGVELLVDCPIICTIGTDYTKTILIPPGLNMRFLKTGQITTRATGPKLFCFLGSCTVDSYNILYDAAVWPMAIAEYGGILTGTLTGAGSGYPASSSFTNVPLTHNGNGSGGAFADITTNSSGNIATFAISGGGVGLGNGYNVGDVLSASATYLGGGSPTAFTWRVDTVNGNSAFYNAYFNCVSITLKNYLQNLYTTSAGTDGVNFIGSNAYPYLNSPTNECALFDYRGGFGSNISFTGKCTIQVPPNAPACNFIPTVFNNANEWNPGSSVVNSGAITLATLTSGGSGYTPGIYNVTLTGAGTAGTAKAKLVVNSIGVVTLTPAVSGDFTTIWSAGAGLSASNVLTYTGSGGSGLQITVNTVGATPTLYTPPSPNPSNYIPMSCAQPPQNITYESLTLDGYCMGATGIVVGLRIKNMTTIRYSDAQNSIANDPMGLQVGSCGYWFAPPHAIYQTFYTNGSNVYVGVLNIDNWYDQGVYVGHPTRRSTGSGLMQRCKFTASNGSYVNMISLCPDGAMQVLSNGLTDCKVNVKSTVITTTNMCVNPGAQSGVSVACSFPGGSSQPLNEIFFKAHVIDTAPIPAGFPFGSDGSVNHIGLYMDLEIQVQDWPNVAYSVTSAAGYTTTSGYNNGSPGFGVSGVNSEVRAKVAFKACTNTSANTKGTLNNAGATYCQNMLYDFEIYGWRQFTSANIDNFKQRMIIGNNISGVTVRLTDTSNNMVLRIDDGLVTERWTQGIVVAPQAGATFAVSSINFPTTFAGEHWAWAMGVNNLNGPSTVQLGWQSGSATALSSSLTGAANQSPFNTLLGLFAIGGTGVPLLTANTTNFSVNESGTATGGTTLSLVDSSKTWTVNQFKNMAVYNITKGWTATIPDNSSGFDAHTIPFYYPQATASASGDTYIIAPCGLLSISAVRTYGVF